MTLHYTFEALPSLNDDRTTSKRLSDEVRAAKEEVIERARFCRASRAFDPSNHDLYVADCGALDEALRKLDRAEAAEEQHHMGGAA